MMRLHSVAAAVLLAAAALAPPAGGALAQNSPFALRGADNPAAARNRAAAEAADIGPGGGAPAAPVAEAPVRPRVPPPFDINRDGRAPQVAPEPEAQGTAYFPSTTVSPLSRGEAIRAEAVEATNRNDRTLLRGLLERQDNAVRELRVALDNEAEWVDSVVDRPIVPYRALRLEGEIASTSWNFFLSSAEAARGGTLSLAFTNSVLVLPEASRLNVYLNGNQIAQTAIDSPERTKVIALPVAATLLRAGENALRIEAEMRHRVDCSIPATYELWTRIDTRLTGFSFPGGRLPLAGLDDLPGVGVGTNGATRIRVMQQDPHATSAIDNMLRAAQIASVRGHFVQPLVEVSDLSRPSAAAPGTLNIVIGTYDEVRAAMPSVPPEAATRPIAALMDTAALGPTVYLTGPDTAAVAAALDRFGLPEELGLPASPVAATPPWLVPDSVPVEGRNTITLSEAGLETIEFSGRRFKTRFQVTLPPDFYAAAYGEVRLYLDAAYSNDVEPGSRLQLFVNGTLSTVVNFTSSDGQVFDDYPIMLGMQSFRPGVNTIEIVADLETKSDAVCLPGGTVPARERFALFPTTRLVFPAFARIGQIPNLAAFVTNGFPYPMSAEPVLVNVASGSLDTIGAAGTLMARVAVSRGSPLATAAVDRVDPYTDAGVIVVAPYHDVSTLALDATEAARVIPPSWLRPFTAPEETGEPQGLDRYDAVLSRLREQLREEEAGLDAAAMGADGSPSRSQMSALERGVSERDRWFEELRRDKGIGSTLAEGGRALRDALQLSSRFGGPTTRNTELAPAPEDATLIFAQAPAPQSVTTAWTLVTAPSPQLLSSSLAAVSAADNWSRIGGRVTAYSLDSNAMEVITAERVDYLATLPLSFDNLRLIAANWFSINSSIYSIALVIAAMLLGVATYALVTRLGRTNR